MVFRTFRIGTIIGIVILSVVIYLKLTYFFNPLTFKQDNVTYLPWSEYRKPLQIEYLVFNDGWKITRVRDEKEIAYVIGELKKGRESIGNTELSQTGRLIHIAVRRLDHEEGDEGAILLHAEGTEDRQMILLRDKYAIELSEELKRLINKRLSEAK